MGAKVQISDQGLDIPFSESMLGGVFDGFGHSLEKDRDWKPEAYLSVDKDAPSPLSRKPIESVFSTGVKAIDGMATIGIGQRVGIFATAGAGKSTLLAMLARAAVADVIVVALIGERGREVSEFIQDSLGPETLQKSVVVVATSDRPAMERVSAARVATSIAEAFREKGKNVLLLMDSVTRYARALREIGLSVGEPPVRRGFPPSVFADLPKLFERVGNDSNGSITAFYTVLSEDEEGLDPIAEETKSILDGHILLTHTLAERGHYPAIDVLGSTSRLFASMATAEHQSSAIAIRRLIDGYNQVELLVRMGEYVAGQDLEADKAIEKEKEIAAFLQQSTMDSIPYEETLAAMSGLAG